ncbi:transposase [Streptomyces sp. NRRL F-2664]|uniref:transposase n=1 Tax=Streptomyces sp. NRRL F-2664 TaxID=1463842 RepID=UPI000AB2FD4D|nr:transposase [Streptomyces sp. NRRL F-2664]
MELHDRLRGHVREDVGRDPEPTAGIVDSQSVRAAATVSAASRGYDAGKKVPGRKRHIVVDCLGLLLAAMATTASVQDRHAAAPLLRPVHDRFSRTSLVRADGGYAGALLWWARQAAPTTPRGSWSSTAGGAWSGPSRGCSAHAGWCTATRDSPRCTSQMVLWSMTMPMSRPARRRV